MDRQIVTTVLTAASSYDLTDLATAKDEIGIPTVDTGNDAFLQRAITQVSKGIGNYCNRIFQVETIRDEIYFENDCSQGESVLLSRYPVVQLNSVEQMLAASSGTALVDGTDYRVQPELGRVIRLAPCSPGEPMRWEPWPLTIEYYTGYAISVSEAETVPSGSPYTVTVDQASAFVIDKGISYTGGAALTNVAANPQAGEYSVSSTGVYTFNAADAVASVTITYAYQQIPEDVVAACLRMITMRFKAKGRDPMLMSRSQPSLGDERYWVGGTPGQDGAFPPEIAGLLDPYRILAVG